MKFFFNKIMMLMMNRDRWLDRWTVLIKEKTGKTSVLELGCGRGLDTRVLCRCGINVIGIDVSKNAIEQAKKEVPQAEFYCQDVRAPFPDIVEERNVILASLSLHYFDWRMTVGLISKIHEKLTVGGILLFRANSTNDINYGAKGNPEIEPNFYLVNGQEKRFFDKEDIQRLFQIGWKVHSQEEKTINRYAKDKVIWEVILEKGGQSGTRLTSRYVGRR